MGKFRQPVSLFGATALAVLLVSWALYELVPKPQGTQGRRPASRRPAFDPVRLESPEAFSKFRVPTDGYPQVLGKHWGGCLDGALLLEPQGIGFQRMRLSRNRGYGHPDLLDVIRQLGLKAQSENLGDILVGDMSQARGGPLVGGHRSHQTGLDADIWFATTRSFGRQELTPSERESLSALDMVSSNGRSLSARFGPSQLRLLELSAKDPRVQRVFVNPVIKRSLCQDPKLRNAYWLRKIRPSFGHNFHFHIRLACPRGDTACFDQPEARGFDPGCDSELESWFLADGRVKPAPTANKEPPAYFVPRDCLVLLDPDRRPTSRPLPAFRRKPRRPASFDEPLLSDRPHEILTRETEAETVE